HIERLRDLANELVRLNVDVILTHNTPGPLAAKQATSTIPIVLATAGDPVGSGIVASLARPGGNVTGLSSQTPDVAGKRLELLRESFFLTPKDLLVFFAPRLSATTSIGPIIKLNEYLILNHLPRRQSLLLIRYAVHSREIRGRHHVG